MLMLGRCALALSNPQRIRVPGWHPPVPMASRNRGENVLRRRVGLDGPRQPRPDRYRASRQREDPAKVADPIMRPPH
jgi:hypothetical protein